MQKYSSIVVTGGAGFIGSHVVDKLLEVGYDRIIVMDNYSGIREGVSVNSTDKCKYIHVDISDSQRVDNLFSEFKPDAVIHLAANANVPFANSNPSVDFRSNALGTFNLINAAILNSVKKFIYSSSAAVYGEPVSVPIKETHQLDPVSYYGVSKLYGERLGFAARYSFGLPFTAIRIFNTYGPRQPRYVLYDLIKKLKNNTSVLEVLGTGDQVRDYSFVGDTANAFLLALTSENSSGEVYNVAGGAPISIKELVRSICQVLDVNPEIVFTGESWKGDISNLTADISKIQSHLGFRPKTKFLDGLASSIIWFKENGYI